MKRTLILLLAPLATFAAEPREVAQPCNEVFPRMAQYMTGFHFDVTVSDSAGGLLTMTYNGGPVAPFRHNVKQAFDKYVEGGSKQYPGVMFPFNSLSVSKASLVFVENRCWRLFCQP